MSNTTGFDIQVRDQDQQPLVVAEAYRGHDAVVVYVDVYKPPKPLTSEDAMVAIAAALLGLNLQRDVRAIAVDVRNELTRMGFEITPKEDRE